ncbi:MAG: MGMT family protein [Bacteroidetes bacterium]|mgnify:FL=1|nr:MGMT family protein [Bacteroidota bacterium]
MKADQSFFDKVYEVVSLVPQGKVTTYGHIAEFIGAKGAARMVGWAMNAAHGQEPPVPAHRVVNRKGMLTGKHHFQTLDMMERLLKSEGIEVKEDQIVNFKELLWIPFNELK